MFTLADKDRTLPPHNSVEEEEGVEKDIINSTISLSRERSIILSPNSILNNLDATDSNAVATAARLICDRAESMRDYRVSLYTTLGCIDIELYWRHAPLTCINFYLLSKMSYFDGCVFHKIIKQRWAQTGDPTATGRGGNSIYGKPFEDEIHPGLRHTGAGVLTMANSGPNTNTSQFLILFAPAPSLDKRNSIFGRISSGINVLKKLSLVQTTKTDRPIYDVKIIRASVAQDTN